MRRWMLALCLAALAGGFAAGCRVTQREVGLVQDLGTIPPTSPMPDEEGPRAGERIDLQELDR